MVEVAHDLNPDALPAKSGPETLKVESDPINGLETRSVYSGWLR